MAIYLRLCQYACNIGLLTSDKQWECIIDVVKAWVDELGRASIRDEDSDRSGLAYIFNLE